MLKRKILAAVLPVVAAGTVVGSGFSAWYFGSLTIKNKELKVSVDLQPEASAAGSISVAFNNGTLNESAVSDVKLRLDQGTGDFSAEGNNRKNPECGISFTYGSTSDSSNIKTLDNIKFSYTINAEELKKLTDADLRVDLTLSVKIRTSLLDFVKVKSGYDWCPDLNLSQNKTEGEYTVYYNTISIVNATGNDYLIDLSTDENEINAMLSYYSSTEVAETTHKSKPLTSKAYTDFANGIQSVINNLKGDDAIVFNASAAVVENI